MVYHIVFHVMSPLYTKVEIDDFDKLSFSVGKEKYTFVVSVFAMEEFKSVIS